MDWAVQLCELNYGDEEIKAVGNVLQRKWLTMGEETIKFETQFADFIGSKNPGVFTSSATASLHLILMALGIKRNDEVIIPALTFVSDANVVVQLGASPIFVDSKSLMDLNVSSEAIIEAVTEQTKAIVIVHFAGFPMDLRKLRSFCDSKNIALIEDCAHAPGASRDGIMSGTSGHFAFYSFFSNKNLAVGEGGMVISNDKEMLDRIRLMRSHGMTSVTLDRHNGRSFTYDVTLNGLNYRADEIRAVLGQVQLRKLMEGNNVRRKLFLKYVDYFGDSDILVPFTPVSNDISPAYHIMPVILPSATDRNSVIASLKEAKIQTSLHYPNFKEFSAFNYLAQSSSLEVTDSICSRSLTLPLHPCMSEADCKLVSDKLIEAVSKWTR